MSPSCYIQVIGNDYGDEMTYRKLENEGSLLLVDKQLSVLPDFRLFCGGDSSSLGGTVYGSEDFHDHIGQDWTLGISYPVYAGEWRSRNPDLGLLIVHSISSGNHPCVVKNIKRGTYGESVMFDIEIGPITETVQERDYTTEELIREYTRDIFFVYHFDGSKRYDPQGFRTTNPNFDFFQLLR